VLKAPEKRGGGKERWGGIEFSALEEGEEGSKKRRGKLKEINWTPFISDARKTCYQYKLRGGGKKKLKEAGSGLLGLRKRKAVSGT